MSRVGEILPADRRDVLDDVDEKKAGEAEVQIYTIVESDQTQVKAIANLELTNEDEAEELERSLDALSLERTVKIIRELVAMHRHDQNFSGELLGHMVDFLHDPNIVENPEKHPEIIHAMKLEALLATTNSPYVEVRANVDPEDDPTMPVSTVRAWFIGVVFCCAGTFIDTLFAFRQPSISVGVNVAQLLAYPLGKFFARILPDWRFSLFGNPMSLNPGPFNRKEHMLITIMANISFNAPYVFYIVPVQALPQYFGMGFARNVGYQICVSLAVNFFGYGLAGLLRRFLVYPSVAIWPATLNTVALVKAFHSGTNEPVKGPFGRTYTWSREKIFLIATLSMFVYFWFPGFIFQAMSLFSWITWIAPDNVTLDSIFGITGGVGLNPLPTFDWNMFGGTGLYLPTFAIVNQCVGIVFAAFMIMAIWFTNTWNTKYLPINSNASFNNKGGSFKVLKVLDENGDFSEALYQKYSQPWFSAGWVVYNFWAFASYTASFTYVLIFHWHDVSRGFRGIWRNLRRRDFEDEDDLEEDVHYRLMKAYKEVPEWHYLVLLVLPIALGVAAVVAWPTHASPAALFYGILIPLVFIIPIGIIQAVTGIPVALNILAAILGGVINSGNPNGLIFFKCWAYLSSWQALGFCNDLKLAHYLKIPPRVTFCAQIVATFIFSMVSALSYNFILGLPNVCTADAPFRFTCPSQTSFYTTTIFWGVLSPKRLFGPGQRYNMMLLGFPLGVVLVLAYWGLRKTFPRSRVLRNVHPVMIAMGPVSWAAPYNLAWNIGNLYVNLISFQWLRRKYLAFWAKWNYVISAAFSSGIAIAGLVIFFAVQIPLGDSANIDWWGNDIVNQGCEGSWGCPGLDVPDVGYFGPTPGTF